MRDVVYKRVILWSCAIAACVATPTDLRADPPPDFPALPLPPSVEGLVAFPKPHSVGRAAHVRLIRREAEQRGLPPEVADAVASVESAYSPNAVGTVGEVGLMQVRPSTAAMLGHSGTVTDLHEPTTNGPGLISPSSAPPWRMRRCQPWTMCLSRLHRALLKPGCEVLA